MIHIKRFRCGYSGDYGYTCVGAPSLKDMFIGNGLTCDDKYNRGLSDPWVVEFTSPIELSKLENYCGYIFGDFYFMIHASSAEEYERWKTEHDAHAYMFFYQDTSTESMFGRALDDYLMHVFVGTAQTDDPYAVDGVDPAAVTPTINTSYYYILAMMDYLEYTSERPDFQDYVDKYMHGGSYMDNYFNLPVEFKGAMASVSPVPDMGTPLANAEIADLVAPEEECRENYDPFTVTGYLDLFHRAYTSYDQQGTLTGSIIIARMRDDDGVSAYTTLVNHLICFNTGMFEPGYMEPQLPVVQTLPTWPVVTQTDSGLDGMALGIVNLTQWRNIVNLWINNIGRSLMHIWGLRSLLVHIMRNQLGNKFDFTISTSSDNVLKWTTESGTHSNPSFSVAGGTMYINGQSKSVSGTTISASQVPVHIWLNVSLSDCDSDTGQYGTVSASLGTSAASGNNKFAISIGGIRKIDVSASNGVPGYTLYQILQERHFVSIELVRVCKEGILYRFTSGASPYKVLATAPCPTQPQS